MADAFSAFQQASVPGGGLPCAPNVGLAFVQTTNPLTCNPHPTVLGHQLISKLALNLLPPMHIQPKHRRRSDRTSDDPKDFA